MGHGADLWMSSGYIAMGLGVDLDARRGCVAMSLGVKPGCHVVVSPWASGSTWMRRERMRLRMVARVRVRLHVGQAMRKGKRVLPREPRGPA